MAGIAQPFATELEREGVSTRRVLERIPTDRLDWQPHPKSMSLGRLAQHVATIPGFMSRMAREDGFDIAKPRPTQPTLESTEELLAAFDTALGEARDFLGGLEDEACAAPWCFSAGERELFTVPRIGMVRSMMLNHLYHHRGQLTLYLRLLDIPVPAIYGTSADENLFADAV
jgi:uncharacterized damage-inducible protein DinB